MGQELDPGQEDHPAYICGRLMAVYEALQYKAQGSVNVTVSDRYFALASTFPLLAFKRIEDLSKAHLRKLRRDNGAAAWALQKRISELTECLDKYGANYPKQLSLEDQGRFVVGYHHQKAADARAAGEAKAAKAENAEASIVAE